MSVTLREKSKISILQREQRKYSKQLLRRSKSITAVGKNDCEENVSGDSSTYIGGRKECSEKSKESRMKLFFALYIGSPLFIFKEGGQIKSV